jgi:hypothetical protein
MTLGAGHEFRLSPIASVTVNGDWVLQVIDRESGSGTESSSLFLFTVGFTFPRIG